MRALHTATPGGHVPFAAVVRHAMRQAQAATQVHDDRAYTHKAARQTNTHGDTRTAHQCARSVHTTSWHSPSHTLKLLSMLVDTMYFPFRAKLTAVMSALCPTAPCMRVQGRVSTGTRRRQTSHSGNQP